VGTIIKTVIILIESTTTTTIIIIKIQIVSALNLLPVLYTSCNIVVGCNVHYYIFIKARIVLNT